MKKLRNEKGFAMAELLAVCIIVLGIFAVLFSNYLPLTAEYENRVTYNNVNAEYAATYIRKAFKDVKVGSLVKNLDKKTYYTLYAGGSLSVGDVFNDKENKNKLSQINKMIEQYGIQEIIITKFKTSEVKDEKNGGYKNGDGLLYNYIKYLPTFKDYKVTKTGKYRIILKTKDYGYATVPLRYAEPNEPKLDSDMLPVYFDGTTIKVADKTNESVTHGWYDYVEKKWANAVKLSSKKVSSYSVGDPVKLGDIQTMWVWIPKYKYTEFKKSAPSQIDVTFITQDNEKDTPHPAFSGKKSTTTGFWIGKYESNGNTIKSGIVPNGKDKQAISPATGSSIITNKQWGAVAYLTYSRYGTCSYNNDSKKVICAGAAHDTDIQTGGEEEYSTTRNMYGVFDMNGGKYEYIDISADDSRGKGTGTDEVDASNEVSHTFDHKFTCENCDGWCETISHYHPCSYNCGTAEKPKYCSCSYYTYTYVWHQDKDITNEDTNAPYKMVGGSGKNCDPIIKVNLAAKTAKGYTYHSWQTDMKNGDGGCEGDYNLRGGAGDGNAWCIKNKVTNTSPKSNSSSARNDTGLYHYDVKSKTGSASYAGIFAYSSSSFVKPSYIVTRSVIKK